MFIIIVVIRHFHARLYSKSGMFESRRSINVLVLYSVIVGVNGNVRVYLIGRTVLEVVIFWSGIFAHSVVFPPNACSKRAF